MNGKALEEERRILVVVVVVEKQNNINNVEVEAEKLLKEASEETRRSLSSSSSNRRRLPAVGGGAAAAHAKVIKKRPDHDVALDAFALADGAKVFETATTTTVVVVVTFGADVFGSVCVLQQSRRQRRRRRRHRRRPLSRPSTRACSGRGRATAHLRRRRRGASGEWVSLRRAPVFCTPVVVVVVGFVLQSEQ